jgi:hypothetical protein
MSKREEMRRRRQVKARRQQLTILGLIALAAIAVTAWIALPNLLPVGEFTTVEKQEWPQASGKSLGAPDAPVLIEEWSDFQ